MSTTQPCLGGRFRLLTDTQVIIQCNCPFRCSSRGQTWYKSEDTEIPYNYDPAMDLEKVFQNPLGHGSSQKTATEKKTLS